MIPLILFLCLGAIVLVLFEWRARREKRPSDSPPARHPQSAPDGECCGQHLVCERETLLQTNAKIEYYDDEELDALSGIAHQDYTEDQYQMLRDVFDTLREDDVAGWVRSLQLRNIQLPDDIRDEALLIVRERRNR